MEWTLPWKSTTVEPVTVHTVGLKTHLFRTKQKFCHLVQVTLNERERILSLKGYFNVLNQRNTGRNAVMSSVMW